MKRINILWIIFLSICIYSCSTYFFTFDTYLENTRPPNLEFKDTLFAFAFIPKQNGIYFRIDNQTNRTALILWEKCYFILPSGNSAKALNIDLINTKEEILIKEKNESLIPPNASFARFTTANTNINEANMMELVSASKYFSNLNTTFSIAYYTNKYTFNSYWPTTLPEKKSLDDYLPTIINFVNQNDKLGLGLTVQIDNRLYEYRFNFRTNRINVYEKPSDWTATETHKVMEARKENNWKWEEINE